MRVIHSAQFEISIDGVPRTYRDRKDLAFQNAQILKSKNPHSDGEKAGEKAAPNLVTLRPRRPRWATVRASRTCAHSPASSRGLAAQHLRLPCH